MTPVLYTDQSARTKIEVRGADAIAFLHNLSSNDVKKLPVGQGSEAFLLNAQGRVVAWLRIFKVRDALWLDADPGQAARIIGHLERYVITEDVQLVDHTSDWAQFLVEPPLLERLGLTPDAVSWRGDAAYVRRNDGMGREAYDVLVPVGKKEEFMRALAGVPLLTADEVEYLRIAAGLPAYGMDVSDANLAQEVNRDAQALCYTKGCYLGQEPMVRIRDLGHVNRKLMRLRGPDDARIVAGTKLMRAGQEVGQVTSAAMGRPTVALGYLRRGHWESGTALQADGVELVVN